MALSTDPFSLDVPGVRDTPATFAYPRCLCRFQDGSVFAYAERGHEFIRASDGELWAVERDEELVSARSGQVLANRRGRVYFAMESGEPVYYERAV
jgi:hypothetical protein